VRVWRFFVPGAALVAIVLAAAATGRDPVSNDTTGARVDARGAAQASAKTRRLQQRGRPVVLAFAGDVHFESPIASELRAGPSLVLASISPVLSRADIAVVNLETAVTTRGTAAAKDFVFRAPPSAFEALAAGGVDVASMANNHGMDFGEVGLRDSLAAARSARFPVIGIGLNDTQAYRPYRATIRGRRIAIIGATQVLDDHLISAWTAGPHHPGLASAKAVPRLLRAVRDAQRTSDTVVVFLHWGLELARCPTSDQRTLARELVDAGADVVVGGHAHRILGAGRMDSALVAYGLGNFVWYGSSELSTQTGVLLVRASGRRIEGYSWEPARIVDGTPRPLTGAERRSEISTWNALRGCTGLRR
jgi:poly-gamma-glutamate capsule biosynthesis protein CapA/YwtB (metallophosphatase superfamily)